MRKAIAPPEFAHFIDDWHFSPALDTGDFVFFSGVTGARADLTVAEDAETQIRDTFENLQGNLKAASLTFDDVVEMTSYHVGLKKQIATFMAVKDEYMAEPYPAWSAIGVSELITDGALVEIRVIARRPGKAG